MEEKRVTFANLGHGAAAEKFDAALACVLDNIADPNTEAEAKREITVKVKFKPTADRRAASVTYSVVSSLAPPADVPSVMSFGTLEGERVAVEFDNRQKSLGFDEEKPARPTDVELLYPSLKERN